MLYPQTLTLSQIQLHWQPSTIIALKHSTHSFKKHSLRYLVKLHHLLNSLLHGIAMIVLKPIRSGYAPLAFPGVQIFQHLTVNIGFRNATCFKPFRTEQLFLLLSRQPQISLCSRVVHGTRTSILSFSRVHTRKFCPAKTCATTSYRVVQQSLVLAALGLETLPSIKAMELRQTPQGSRNK